MSAIPAQARPLPTREGFGRGLLELGERDARVVAVEADISKSTKSIYFAQRFPERFFNVGCAEQNALGVAAGLSTCGLIPFVSTYAVFASMRACEQIRTTVCYARANVKICPSHGGLTPGGDGPTHQAIDDLGLMRTIPNLTVVMPSDYHQMRAAVFAAARHDGPVYLRGTRDAVPQIHDESILDRFVLGQGLWHRRGGDVGLIAIGDMVYHTLAAAAQLEREGISAGVLEIHTLKPLDGEKVLELAQETGCLVTVEDHTILNGLGSAVAETLGEEYPVPMRRIGIRDTFAESGDYPKLLSKYGLGVADIVAAARRVMERKAKGPAWRP